MIRVFFLFILAASGAVHAQGTGDTVRGLTCEWLVNEQVVSKHRNCTYYVDVFGTDGTFEFGPNKVDFLGDLDSDRDVRINGRPARRSFQKPSCFYITGTAEGFCVY